MSASEKQGYFYCFLLWRLGYFADINGQFPQLSDMLLVNEVYFSSVCFIENNPHNSLTSAHRAINFSVYLINGNWVSFFNKSIKNIFTEILTFDDNFFRLWMNFWIKSCKCVNPKCFFSYSWSNWSRIQTKKASTPHHRYLRSSRNKYLHSLLLKFFQYLCFEVGALWKTTNHENKINVFIFWLNLLD
jgi:hypothetical protein